MDTAPFTLEITQDAPAVFHAPPCSGSLDLRLGDCMEGMKTFPDGYFDLAIVDPPYGIGRDGQKETNTKNAIHRRRKWESKGWDAATPRPEYFDELRRVSKHQIVWGANYMTQHLPPSMGWIYWDKGQKLSMSDGELAFCSMQRALRSVTFNRCEAREDGLIHPTQKPVKLYKWLLENYAKPGQRVLDTHMGSGSIAIAAHYCGIHLTAYEIDADYFHAAKARIARETAQAELFSPQNARDLAPPP
jgi:site-specific DNA-methyltransferase (adenine-specific)